MRNFILLAQKVSEDWTSSELWPFIMRPLSYYGTSFHILHVLVIMPWSIMALFLYHVITITAGVILALLWCHGPSTAVLKVKVTIHVVMVSNNPWTTNLSCKSTQDTVHRAKLHNKMSVHGHQLTRNCSQFLGTVHGQHLKRMMPEAPAVK